MQSPSDDHTLFRFTKEEVAYMAWVARWADGRHLKTGGEDYTLDHLATKIAWHHTKASQ